MRNEKVGASNNNATTKISNTLRTGTLSKTLSKNVKESENMNERIRIGVCPSHYDLQRNPKRSRNQDDDIVFDKLW